MDSAPKKYYPLGAKTLWMLIFKKSIAVALLVPAWIFGFLLIEYVPLAYVNLWSNAMMAYSAVVIFAAILTLFIGWLQYVRYAIFVDEKSLKLRRGLINVEELGIPYRRIKDANIKRSLLDQIVGVSDIVITLIDNDDDNKDPEQDPVIVLPCLRQKTALQIQDMILRRAQVEEINVLGQHGIR